MRRKTIHLPPRVDCLYCNGLRDSCECVKPATTEAHVRERERAALVSAHFKNNGTVAELKDVLAKFDAQI